MKHGKKKETSSTCFDEGDEVWAERTRGWVRALLCFAARAHVLVTLITPNLRSGPTRASPSFWLFLPPFFPEHLPVAQSGELAKAGGSKVIVSHAPLCT